MKTKSLLLQLGSLFFAMGFGLTACDDSDSYSSVGNGGVDSSVCAVNPRTCGSSYSQYPRPTTLRPHPMPHRYVNYRGISRTEMHGRSMGFRSRFGYTFPDLFAETFSLSSASSERFLNALERAQKRDRKPLASLGLEARDIEVLARFSLPAASSVERLARNLDQETHATTAMLSTLISTSRTRLEQRCAGPDRSKIEKACEANRF